MEDKDRNILLRRLTVWATPFSGLDKFSWPSCESTGIFLQLTKVRKKRPISVAVKHQTDFWWEQFCLDRSFLKLVIRPWRLDSTSSDVLDRSLDEITLPTSKDDRDNGPPPSPANINGTIWASLERVTRGFVSPDGWFHLVANWCAESRNNLRVRSLMCWYVGVCLHVAITYCLHLHIEIKTTRQRRKLHMGHYSFHFHLLFF